MDFGKALEAMKAGKKIRRTSWEKGISILLGTKEQYGDDITIASYIMKNGSEIEMYPLRIHDILAEDWEILEDGMMFSKTDLLKENLHISLPSFGFDETFEAGKWTVKKDTYPMKVVLEFQKTE